MPWTYGRTSPPKKSSYRGGGGSTSAWNTSGQTASLKNACAQYGLTEEQVSSADPPIPCQWRSCHGNMYAVVKLSDMAALKQRIKTKAEEDKKKALIDKLGQEGYDKMLAEEKAKKDAAAAAAKSAAEREKTVMKLVRKLEVAMTASSDGVADTLDGMTITKTNAKKEWYTDVEQLTPVDPSKKNSKYHLSDVIGRAITKHGVSYSTGNNLAGKIANYPERKKFYARHLLDKFDEDAKKTDPGIVEEVYESVRSKISERMEAKAAAVRKAQAELKIEEGKLAAFDGMAEGMTKKRSAVEAAAKGAATEKENTENDSKPAAKKAKAG